MVIVTMPHEARNGPQSAMVDSADRYPGTIAIDTNGAVAPAG